MSVYIREVKTINQDYDYLYGNAIARVFGSQSDNKGEKTEYVVGHIINNHEPQINEEKANVSSTMYIR